MKNAKKSEETEQMLVIAWASWNESKYPELRWLHHIPNGGNRGISEAIRFKQEGVRPGVSDLHLPYAHGKYHGLWIEMKYGTGRLQEEQKEFLQAMEQAGHFVATCYTWHDAIDVLERYIELMPNAEMHLKNNAEWENGTEKIWRKRTKKEKEWDLYRE